MCITKIFEFLVNYFLSLADSMILIKVDFMLGSLTKKPSTSLRTIKSLQFFSSTNPPYIILILLEIF